MKTGKIEQREKQRLISPEVSPPKLSRKERLRLANSERSVLRAVWSNMHRFFKQNAITSNLHGMKKRRRIELYCRVLGLELPKINPDKFVLSEYEREGSPIKKGTKFNVPAKRVVTNEIKARAKELGLTQNYKTFLRSKYWGEVRKTVLKRDKNKCTDCGEKKRLHVHHKTYDNHFCEHEHLEDLITLCHTCHNKIHGKSVDDKS